jgi:hypothetical protein
MPQICHSVFHNFVKAFSTHIPAQPAFRDDTTVVVMPICKDKVFHENLSVFMGCAQPG